MNIPISGAVNHSSPSLSRLVTIESVDGLTLGKMRGFQRQSFA